MKRTIIFALVTVLICLLVLSGCRNASVNDVSFDTETAESDNPVKISDPYDELLYAMDGTPQRMAVAYLGYFGHTNMEEFDEDEEYAFSSADPFSYIKSKAPEFCRELPFLMSIPDENIIGDRTGEIYCIIPADKNASVTVSYTGLNENGEDLSQILYESDNGEPFILFCNTDWSPEMLVKIEEINGNSFFWSPKLDNKYYISMMLNDEYEEMILDISPYAECLFSDYRSMLENGYTPPSDAQLLNTIWSIEESYPYSQYYRVNFNESTADIYWKTEDGEEHEYLNASYTLDFTDKISILTLDLGEFAGVHKYILLTDTEGHMLYIAVDSTNKNITHRDEKQYRFLYQDVNSGR